jgi:hypothetical protein
MAATLYDMRITAAAALLALTLGAAPAPPPAAAPDAIPHDIALFLDALSHSGKRRVTLRAEALGTRFFIEEPAGVTVYAWSGGQYKKDAFLAGATLAKAVAKYR